MLSINDLRNKMVILIDGAPYQILEVKHLHMGRGGASVQTKIKNLVTGQVFSRNFKPADAFREAEIEKRPLTYLYGERGGYVFAETSNPRSRFRLTAAALGDTTKWLKPNAEVEATFLAGKPLTVAIPIKMDLKVTDAPAGIRGDTAQGGSKMVTVETGAKIQTPLFVNEGDVIRVNTETGEYVERVSKG